MADEAPTSEAPSPPMSTETDSTTRPRWLATCALLLCGCADTVSLGRADPFGDGGMQRWPDQGLVYNDALPRFDNPTTDAVRADRPPVQATFPDEYRPGARCPADMVLVPGATFDMGMRQYVDPLVDHWPSRPLHAVRVSDFCMDVTEVTVGGYRRCVTGAGCTAPQRLDGCNWDLPGRENHPITCVTWEQSSDYCQRRGARLPTEAQWEYAARGTDGRSYPWGDDGPDRQLCWGGHGDQIGTCPVGSFPAGASPFGVLDMAGNVIEHIADWYGPYADPAAALLVDPTGPVGGTGHVIRDASSSSYRALSFRSAMRTPFEGTATPVIGFRCARPAR